MLYDLAEGLRRNDRDARSFNYDARPLVAGELGAGTLGTDTPCFCPEDIADFCLSGAPCVSA